MPVHDIVATVRALAPHTHVLPGVAIAVAHTDRIKQNVLQDLLELMEFLPN